MRMLRMSEPEGVGSNLSALTYMLWIMPWRYILRDCR
jgi:hypothetical protein